jgi:hypothetical protein
LDFSSRLDERLEHDRRQVDQQEVAAAERADVRRPVEHRVERLAGIGLGDDGLAQVYSPTVLTTLRFGRLQAVAHPLQERHGRRASVTVVDIDVRAA